MPNISNELVIGSGYATYKNARPQLLSNGWIVAAVYSATASRLQFRVKKSSTAAWEDLAFLTNSNVLSWSLAVKGTRVFATLHTSSSNATLFLNFEATAVSNSTTLSAVSIDNTSTSGQFNGEDLKINDAGTELHHGFSAKTSTYPNAFNPRYLRGVINTDGSVTWDSAVTIFNSNATGDNYANPKLEFKPNGSVFLVCDYNTSSGVGQIVTFSPNSGLIFTGIATRVIVFNVNYAQSFPDWIYVPQSINGLTNGRFWLTWHGKDISNSTTFNIFTTYSDDTGATWVTPTKQTAFNGLSQTNATFTVDKTGKVFLVWDSVENPAGSNVTVTAYKVFSGGSWGSRLTYSGDDHLNATSLFDNKFSLVMTKPPVIRQYGSGVRFSGEYFAGASVSPASGALGNKETATLTVYTVTPEAGSTVTQIVEKLNGVTLNTYNNPASLSRTLTVPTATWDTLAYFATHTASITVTDSNGATMVTTYSFAKRLATGASLLEATKANTDAKNRISTKRDALAAQVGLSAGSTFDAISAQLASGTAFKKFATGTYGTASTVTVSGLGFKPLYVIILGMSGTNRFTSVYDGTDSTLQGGYLKGALVGTTMSYGNLSEVSVSADGFSIPVQFSGFNKVWFAFGN